VSRLIVIVCTREMHSFANVQSSGIGIVDLDGNAGRVEFGSPAMTDTRIIVRPVLSRVMESSQLIADQVFARRSRGNFDSPRLVISKGFDRPSISIPGLLAYIVRAELTPLSLANIHILAIIVGARCNEDTVSTFIMCPADTLVRRPLYIDRFADINRCGLSRGLGPIPAGDIAAPNVVSRR